MTEEYEQVKADVEAGRRELGKDAMSVNTLEEARYRIDYLSEMCIKAQGEAEDLKVQLREKDEDIEGLKEVIKEKESKVAREQMTRWNLEDDKNHLIEAMNHFSAAVAEKT